MGNAANGCKLGSVTLLITCLSVKAHLKRQNFTYFGTLTSKYLATRIASGNLNNRKGFRL